jgi:hypothetical protein
MRRFSRISDYLEAVGGIASRPEILAEGFTIDRIRFAVQLGSVQPLCRGWYGSRNLPHVIRDAWRSGGPLACVSALAFLGFIEPVPHEPLHVCRRTRGHRLRYASTAVIHWSDEALRSGSRLAISAHVAARQAASCASVWGREDHFTQLAEHLDSLRLDAQ